LFDLNKKLRLRKVMNGVSRQGDPIGTRRVNDENRVIGGTGLIGSKVVSILRKAGHDVHRRRGRPRQLPVVR
jgi:hypothetical protein